MVCSRIHNILKRTILLFPFTIYVLLLFYKSVLPWCQDMHMYPITGKLRDISNGNKLYRENKEIEPINVKKVRYIHQPNKTCPVSRIHVVCLVKSAPGRSKMRQVIRKTWGKLVVERGNILLFSLGESKGLKEDIDMEAVKYGDIVQGDFEDTYGNLTLKTMMGIQWISRFCTRASFVFLVDDDVMVNFHNLLKFTSSIPDDEMSTLLSGCVVSGSTPMRNKGKWVISMEDYPYPCYPTYVSGTAIVTTGQVIQKLNAAIPYVKFFVYEDVFLGIVAWKLGIQPHYKSSKFYIGDKDIHLLPCVIASHMRKIHADVYEKRYESLVQLPCKEQMFKI